MTSVDPISIYSCLVQAFLRIYPYETFSAEVPHFELFYKEVETLRSGVLTEEEEEAIRGSAHLFYTEIRNVADDPKIEVSEEVLKCVAIVIDRQFLEAKTRSLLHSVYKETLKATQKQDKAPEEDDEEDSEGDGLPLVPEIERLQFGGDISLEEFTKNFEKEAAWDEIDSHSIAKACLEFYQVA